MPEELEGTEQVEIDSAGELETDLGTDGADAQTTPEPSPYADLSDIPEEFRGLVETKLQEKQKNLEAGFTPKFQTLAEERKAFEAERQAFLDGKTTTQQPTADPGYVDPLADADWEGGWTQDGTPVTQVMYQQFQAAMQGIANYLQQRDGTLTQLESHFSQQQRAEQMSALKAEYGDFDEAALAEAAKASPGIPLDFVAAKMLMPQVRERATKTAYENKQTKLNANEPAASNAKTVPNVDTSKWGIPEFAEFARTHPGVKLSR